MTVYWALSSMPTSLSGRIALITGASRGIGRAMALSLSAAGATLALVARDAGKLESVRRDIESAGGRAGVFPADAKQGDGVARVARGAAAQLGPVQIPINNAGINIRKPVVEFTLAEWRQVMDTNHTSAFLMCRTIVPHMRGTGYGRVLNIASTMAHVSIPARAAYSSSKAALLGLTRALALELAPDRITVNSISPGPIATEMNTVLLENPEANRQFLSNVPLGRWGRPEAPGSLACYLCSDDAGFITGADFLIDGGWCAR